MPMPRLESNDSENYASLKIFEYCLKLKHIYFIKITLLNKIGKSTFVFQEKLQLFKSLDVINHGFFIHHDLENSYL